jgi:2-(1,2-epoxy-1,2-dihydrophenyl)acetyl-CoA isomerase
VPTLGPFGDVSVAFGDAAHVATVEIHRPPANFFDAELISSIAEAFEALDTDPRCRAIVLCSEGKHFCAGALFTPADPVDGQGTAEGAAALSSDSLSDFGGPALLYREAIRLFEAKTPVVAAVQGAAIGGGLGLACAADFRVGWEGSRFSANFARLGFHQGFGLSVTLPRIVGDQRALELLYTGKRLRGDEAHAIGLCDRLAPREEALRDVATELAAEIASSAPLAVTSIRETMRGHLVSEVRSATAREATEQERLRTTSDWLEGIRATSERRPPRFEGR